MAFACLRVDLAGAERQDVGVVVLAGVPGQRLVVAGGGEHAGDLVGRHGRADAGAVDHDAEVARSRGHRRATAAAKTRVVDRLLAGRAAVGDRVPERRDERGELLLQLEAAVVGADGDLEGVFHATTMI